MIQTPDILENDFRKVNSHFQAVSGIVVSPLDKAPSPKALSDAREKAGLSLDEAGRLLGVTGRTVFNYETKGPPPEKARAVMEAYADYNAGRRSLPEIGLADVSGNAGQSPGNGSPEPRFPFAQVLRTPAVRARLAAFRAELIEMGASEDGEERMMSALRDRQRVAEFVGGRENDLYSEREVIQVIDNYARIARDIGTALGMP